MHVNVDLSLSPYNVFALFLFVNFGQSATISLFVLGIRQGEVAI